MARIFSRERDRLVHQRPVPLRFTTNIALGGSTLATAWQAWRSEKFSFFCTCSAALHLRTGLRGFSVHLLQDMYVHRWVDNYLLRPVVLLLQLVEALCLRGVHRAVRLPSAVERSLAGLRFFPTSRTERPEARLASASRNLWTICSAKYPLSLESTPSLPH